jgi:hypothetical protein
MCQGTQLTFARNYSITSLARTSNEGGTVRPSALAVLRLITSSYLVGCATGLSQRQVRAWSAMPPWPPNSAAQRNDAMGQMPPAGEDHEIKH